MSKFIRGFTLLEMLVALAVLAISLAAATRVGGSAARMTEELQQRTLVVWGTENRISEVRLGLTSNEVGESSGELLMAGEVLRWQQKISPTPNNAFRKIELTYSAADGKVTHRQTAYLYMP